MGCGRALWSTPSFLLSTCPFMANSSTLPSGHGIYSGSCRRSHPHLTVSQKRCNHAGDIPRISKPTSLEDISSHSCAVGGWSDPAIDGASALVVVTTTGGVSSSSDRWRTRRWSNCHHWWRSGRARYDTFSADVFLKWGADLPTFRAGGGLVLAVGTVASMSPR